MTQKIKNLIEEILDKIGVSYKSVDVEKSDVVDSPRYVIKSEESSLLIGNRGENLRSLHYLLKKILEKEEEFEENKSFILDVGNYQEKKIQEIKNKAVILGERARFFKKDIEMPPMSSYERMVVHTVLGGHTDIRTESSGFGKNRRVIIKYLENLENF